MFRAKPFLNLVFLVFIYPVLAFSVNINNAASSNTAQSPSNSYFIENKGQWDSDIRYFADLKNVKLSVADNCIYFDFLYKTVNKTQNHPFKRVLGNVIKMNFANSNSYSFAINGKKNRMVYNFFKGNNKNRRIRNARTFDNVFIKNIYSGIDVELTLDGYFPRYNFIISKNANPADIKFNFEGAERIEISDDGELVFKTKYGDIYNSKIFAYQEIGGKIHEVECNFIYEEQNIGFDLGDYDKNYSLVIDPLIYCTYFGGSAEDAITDINVIDETKFVVCGWTESTNIFTTPGAYDEEINEERDAFVTMFETDGANTKPIVSTIIGGMGIDQANAIDSDQNGYIYITGNTNSPDYPIESAYSFELRGVWDAFITKFNQDLSDIEYSTYFGGGDDEFSYDIRVDNSGNAHICGQTSSDNMPRSSGAIQNKLRGNTDGFVLKLKPNGRNLEFATYVGGLQDEAIYGLDIDETGAVYLTGKTNSDGFPIAPWRTGMGGRIVEKPYDYTFNGGWDAFVSKLIGNGGKFEYSSFFGSYGDEVGRAIAYIGNGAVIFAGETSNIGSEDFPITGAAFQQQQNGNTDIFVTRFDKLTTIGTFDSMPLVFSSFLGGKGNENVNDIKLNLRNNSVLVTGKTKSNRFPTVNTDDSKLNGGTDAFISEMIIVGTDLMYSAYIGGRGDDEGFGVATDMFGSYYAAGSTKSDNFLLSQNAHSDSLGGLMDGFVSKSNKGEISISNPSGGEKFCWGSAVSIQFFTRYFNIEGAFQIEIGRESTGDWIILTDSLTERIFNWTVPDDSEEGDDYKIRISHASGLFVTSEVAFSIYAPPRITKLDYNIDNLVLCEGGEIYIKAEAAGEGLIYQWKFNDVEIPGETGSELKILNATLDNNGSYSVEISGKCPPAIESEAVEFIVKRAAAITTQPADQTVDEGRKVVFSVVAEGDSLKYQWLKDDTEISGEDRPELIIDKVRKSDEGSYSCVITGECGTATSRQAILKINPSSSVAFDYGNNSTNGINLELEGPPENYILNITSKIETTITIGLYDNIGQKVEILFAGFLTEGVRRLPLSTRHLSSGIYWIAAKFNNESVSVKLNVTK